jgi:adenylylsulfate kinase
MEHANQDHHGKRFELQKGATFWFTGLSGAGKSTLSEAIKARLDVMLEDNHKVFILDGDIIRTGLNKGLTFSPEDRAENIRRISEVSKLFALSGQIVFVAFISPYGKDRNFAKDIHRASNIPFYECYVSPPLEVCEERDVKGLYKKARAGEIKNFTGISDPYEAPENPDMNIKTHEFSIDQCVDQVLERMFHDGVLTDNKRVKIAQNLYETLSETDAAEAATLKSVEIDVEQVEYL